ncbi:MAG: TetR/AcrR family transcriptional regulator [Ignavibacteriales bacterium]|nr:TetR/AcrR family transcriptional regulator [Ignavibacteriales bacterium]
MILEEKDRIVESASEKFLSQGISKVTLDEIASDLRMSKKTMYKFFPSKDELLRSIVHLMMGRMERQIEAIVSSNKPFPEKMTELMAFAGKFIGRLSTQFVHDMERFAPALWKEVETFRRERIFSRLEKMFVQAKHEGFFRSDLDHTLFMLMFLHSMQGIMNPHTLSQHSFSAQQAFKGIFKILFEGALTDTARKEFHFFDSLFSEQ